jgi:hypothetical protein
LGSVDRLVYRTYLLPRAQYTPLWDNNGAHKLGTSEPALLTAASASSPPCATTKAKLNPWAPFQGALQVNQANQLLYVDGAAI